MIVEQWCRELVGFSSGVWAEFMRMSDPLGGLVEPNHYRSLFRECSTDGQRVAGSVSAEFATRDPEQILQSLGVKVVAITEHEDVQGQAVFALFHEPDLIELFENNAHRTQSLIDDGGLSEWMGGALDVRKLILAHELFHVLCLREEAQDWRCLRKVIETRGFKLFRHKSRLPSLEEVSAMAFAERLVDAPCSPYVLTILMSVSSDSADASRMYGQLHSIASHLGEEEASDR